MATQVENFLTSLNVPQLGRVIHGARRHQHAVGVEAEADDLHLVALERVVALARVGVPDFGCAVEGARHDFISIRIVEGHGVDHIFVLLQRQQLLAGDSVPDLARAVVAAGDKFIS